MGKRKKEFCYDYETLAQLSGQRYNSIVIANGRHGSKPQLIAEDLASVCVWLAAHGRPALRAAIAAQVLPVALGPVSEEILTGIFQRDFVPEKNRRHRMRRTKIKRR